MNPVLLSPNPKFFQIFLGPVCLFLFPTFGNISGGHGYKIYLAGCLAHRKNSISGHDDLCVPSILEPKARGKLYAPLHMFLCVL